MAGLLLKVWEAGGFGVEEFKSGVRVGTVSLQAVLLAMAKRIMKSY